MATSVECENVADTISITSFDVGTSTASSNNYVYGSIGTSAVYYSTPTYDSKFWQSDIDTKSLAWQSYCAIHGIWCASGICIFCKEQENRQMKFKIGDRVRIITAVQDSDKIGEIRTIIRIDISSETVFLEGCRAGWGLHSDGIKLIEKENITMDSGRIGGNALSRLAKSLFNGRVKKFIEVGFLTKDLEVTEKFTRGAMAIVMEDLLSHKEGDAELTVSEVGRKLEAQADEEIAEAKEEKCCK